MEIPHVLREVRGARVQQEQIDSGTEAIEQPVVRHEGQVVSVLTTFDPSGRFLLTTFDPPGVILTNRFDPPDLVT